MRVLAYCFLVLGSLRSSGEEPPELLEWRPIRDKLMQFPEVYIESKTYRDVEVWFFVPAGKVAPLRPELWQQVLRDRESKKVEPSIFPMGYHEGMIVLSEGEGGRMYILRIEENHLIQMREATYRGKNDEIRIYQPVTGNGPGWNFQSKELAQALLALPGVALTDEEKRPWVKEGAGKKKKKSKP